jgi:hypothetical protein
VTSGINRGTKQLHKALLDMDAALKGRQRKSFVEAYARAGQAMLTNQFLFQTVLEMAGGGVDIEYRIEGTDISSYRLALETTDQVGHLVREDRPPMLDNPVGRGQPTRERGVIVTPDWPYGYSPTQW